jgi:hypothetical protein
MDSSGDDGVAIKVRDASLLRSVEARNVYKHLYA